MQNTIIRGLLILGSEVENDLRNKRRKFMVYEEFKMAIKEELQKLVNMLESED